MSTTSQWRRHLDKLSSLFDLDLFTNLDGQLNNNNNDHRQCRYLSPHSFKLFNRKLSNSEVKSSFSVFHNNVVSINQNLENLTLLLDEIDFQFNLIGVRGCSLRSVRSFCSKHGIKKQIPVSDKTLDGVVQTTI